MKTRQTFLRNAPIILIGVAIALFAAACSDDGETDPTTAGEATPETDPDATETTPDRTQVTRGGVLTEASAFNPESTDPQLSSLRAAWFSVPFDSFFSYRLVEGTTDEFEMEPGLATSYELVDDTTVELTLREGVTFHDGSDWNADVAKWNIERARDHELSTVSTTVAAVDDVVVVDDHTIQLILNEPQPTLQLQLTPANPLNVFLVSQEAVESMGDEEFARAAVGSGPMRITNWIPDERLELEAVEGHWESGVDGEPLPYLDEYIIRFITDQSVSAIELRTGNVEIMSPLNQDVEQLDNEPNITVYPLPARDGGQPSFYIASDPDSPSPFAHDVRLRQAIQHAIDREAMASTLGFGRGAAHYYWGWYPGVPGYDESLPRYEYDPERARDLLADAGYPDGIELEVKVINRPSDVQPLEVMQAMLGEVGIQLTINAMDRTPWVDDGSSGNFEALSHGNSAMIEPLLRQESRTDSQYNWASYSNPEVDELWGRAATEQDPEQREQIFHEIQTHIHEDAYHFIGYRSPLMMAHLNDLHGLETDHNFRYLWLGE